MERHGQSLASAHRLGPPRPAAELLLARLADNESVLTDASRQLAEASAEGRRISPAGEWLLDNFYLVEEQVRIAQRHLPRGYSRELPRLARGPSAGLPRVYDIALEAIAHGDGRVDAEGLRRFVAAYQSVAPLRLGELWAVPIMLRLALIEEPAPRRRARDLRAPRPLAGRALGRAHDGHGRERAAQGGARSRRHGALRAADEHLLRRRVHAQAAGPERGAGAAAGLDRAVAAESGHSIEYLVQQEAQQQAADQVSIGNSIGSLRELSAIDWREFVEDMSLVDQALRTDPAGVYPRMDFGSRDRYRHAVESLARRSERSEPEVARAAVDLARAAPREESEARLRHVGHYLVDDGQDVLEQFVQARMPLGCGCGAWPRACRCCSTWVRSCC
jgi:hypothetical protein